jgi:hypothetical protein
VALPVTLVVYRDRDAAIQERELTQALGERIEAEFRGLEDLIVRPEGDLGSALLRRARDVEVAKRIASLVRLRIHLTVAPDLQFQRLGERVDDRHAHAVQTARDLVAVVVELAACVQHRQRHFGCRSPAAVAIDRNAAAVVHDRHRMIDVNRDVDLIAEPGERFVNRVVDDLVDEMVQAGHSRRADVHGRTFADGLETLEDLDLVRAVVVRVCGLAIVRPGCRVLRGDLRIERPRLDLLRI